MAGEDTSLYIIDQQSYVTEYIPDLNKKASEITNTYGIMLIDSEEDNEWFIYKSGKENDLFTADDEEAMWDAFSACQYYDEAIDAYLDKAGDILETKTGVVLSDTTGETAEGF